MKQAFRLEKHQEMQIEQEATEVIKNNNIKSLPVEVLDIAENHDILVRAKPDTSCSGVSGMLCRVGNNFGIMYATHIPSDGFQRFSIAHELGHYFLPGHIDAIDGIFLNGDIHKSRAGFVSSDLYEKEADRFAAALLMPKDLFCQAMLGFNGGLIGIESLASLCRTSLTTTAIQYAKNCTIPVAVIVSTGPAIDFCFLSKPMKKIDDFQWLKKGQAVPQHTLTRIFNEDLSNVTDTQRKSTTINIREWFGGGTDVDVYEEVIGLGTYGKTLTVLTAEAFTDEINSDGLTPLS